VSKYLLDKFLFTVDRDPELVERYREDPRGTVRMWESEYANRILGCVTGESSTWLRFDKTEREALATHDYPKLFELGAHGNRIEQAERALEHRADLVPGLEHVDGLFLHQQLEPLGQRRLAAAHRAKQIEHLLALLEALRGVTEEPDDPLDRLLHAVEILEGGIDLDGAVHEDPAEARILAGVDHDRLADGLQEALGGARIKRRVVRAGPEIVLQRVFHLAPVFIQARVNSEDAFVESHLLTSIDSLSTATVSTVHSVNVRPRRKIRVADHGHDFPVIIFAERIRSAAPSRPPAAAKVLEQRIRKQHAKTLWQL